MIVNGLWFQDAFNYDFSAISNSSTPVATQQGEISFCAYNGGGWRKVVEHMNRTATHADWYSSHSRHQIYAKGKKVDLGKPLLDAETELIQIQMDMPQIPATVPKSGG